MFLNKKDFNVLTGKIKDYSGIIITDDKEYLLEARLMPIAQKHGLAHLSDLISYLEKNHNENLLIEIIEGMTTNESSFFRDQKPFDCLRNKIIPDIASKHPEKNSYRIWSAASSSGQEAYSIAMTLLESREFLGKKFEIIATDIDQTVLEKAKEGLYSQFEVQRGIPDHLLKKYFTQCGDHWQVKDTLRKMITYSKFNLLSDSTALGKFDIIFCRNVLIYFDNATKEKVIANLVKVMEPHSYLFTGGTESLLGLNTGLKPLENMVSLFQLKPSS